MYQFNFVVRLVFRLLAKIVGQVAVLKHSQGLPCRYLELAEHRINAAHFVFANEQIGQMDLPVHQSAIGMLINKESARSKGTKGHVPLMHFLGKTGFRGIAVAEHDTCDLIEPKPDIMVTVKRRISGPQLVPAGTARGQQAFNGRGKTLTGECSRGVI